MFAMVVSTFYKFVRLDDLPERKARLQQECARLGVIGTILLAPEGINATVAGPKESLQSLLAYLRSDQLLADLKSKESTAQDAPFGRMRVRLKKEIVTIRRPGADPTVCVGEYVAPCEWNRLIQDPDVILVDTRNDYEVEAGTFKGAIDPRLNSFGEFPDFVETRLDPEQHKKVAMFCTGGIRCEKASAYMLSQGFQAVYHLKGGILKYLEDIDQGESMFEGKCFVFDGREVVDETAFGNQLALSRENS